jgi:holo-ACP synthase
MKSSIINSKSIHNSFKGDEKMLKGQPVSLSLMLLCRERRAEIQKKYLLQYNKSIVSFSLNIPGPIKTSDSIRLLFEEGKQAILLSILKENGIILDMTEFHEVTGDELILCTDANAAAIKDRTVFVEETHPLGRLFDIDVIDTSGIKLGRSLPRKCLLCSNDVWECSASRAHTVDELQKEIEKLLENYFVK